MRLRSRQLQPWMAGRNNCPGIYWRVLGTFLLALALAFSFNPPPARAQNLTRFGGGYVVPAGQQVENALAIFGPVTVDGRARDVVGTGGRVEVNGEVDNSVVAVGGQVSISGRVNRDVIAVAGPVAVSGRIAGDLVVVGGPLILASTAQVGGDLVVIGGSLQKEPGAVVGGNEVQLALQQAFLEQVGQWLRGYPLPGLTSPAFWWRLFTLILMAIVLLFISIIFPGTTARVAETAMLLPGKSLLWGFLIAFLALPATVLLFITILGIPLAGLLWLALACLYFLGMAGLSLATGKRILAALGSRQAEIYAATLAGILIISLVTWLPYLGIVAGLMVKAAALGAAAVTMAGRAGTSNIN
ncbi:MULTISPECIES: bactofilin family protein [Neomoorella]|uniref:Polymer-forming cytoskeletal n=1 Tax=Neomoorella thermoacetica TaxID=1525 RepID=A0A1J5JDP6_NEOTH|nr:MULTISPECIES: polymer-forming cytoskeletal protein [Moorella]OIQ07646.1 hypothetical protein MOOR_27440 [Moorella thermoacetica]OIQ10410.1 hypothetical protein MOOTH_26910 [Moorella thermoacetica]